MNLDLHGTVEILRKRGALAGSHLVYRSEFAAREAGHTTVYWKRAQEGQWAISDDGYAAEVFQRKVYGGRQPRVFLVMATCRVWINANAVLHIRDYLKAGKYSATTPNVDWNQRESRLMRTRETVSAYVAMILRDGFADWELLGRVYRSDQKDLGASARRLILRNPAVQRMVHLELAEAVRATGTDEAFVIDGIKDAIEMARKKGDAGTMLKGAAIFGRMLGME